MSTTAEQLNHLLTSRYQLDQVVPEYRADFADHIKGLIGNIDSEIEGYNNAEQQRDLSIKYTWGHNHDFGAFQLRGQMGDRHIHILAEFIDQYNLPLDLTGKRILDVGAWTGGTCLLLCALGAEVIALEEVVKYANTIEYLAKAFGLTDLSCKPISLYNLEDQDTYDYILYSGVIYHVTDPILSLRILFNALKDGGKIFVETMSVNVGATIPPMAAVEGPKVMHGGSKENLNRGGWNYFLPSCTALALWMETAGFEDVQVGAINNNQRIKAAGVRWQHKDILRAGLSRPDVR